MPDQCAKQHDLYWSNPSFYFDQKAVGSAQLLLMKDQPMLLSEGCNVPENKRSCSRGQRVQTATTSALSKDLQNNLTIQLIKL